MGVGKVYCMFSCFIFVVSVFQHPKYRSQCSVTICQKPAMQILGRLQWLLYVTCNKGDTNIFIALWGTKFSGGRGGLGLGVVVSHVAQCQGNRLEVHDRSSFFLVIPFECTVITLQSSLVAHDPWASSVQISAMEGAYTCD